MKIKNIFLYFAILILLAASCQRKPTPLDDPKTSSTPKIFTSSPQITTTRIIKTKVPSVTITPTPVYPLTPLPTLSKNEAEILVQDLLENNKDCHLPCWWGFVPGKTTWNEALQFLNTFVTSIEQGVSGHITKDGITFQTTNYSIGYDIPGIPNEGGALFSLRNGVISSITVGGNSTEKRFKLHQLLAEYGRPDQVYISTFQNVPDNYLPFYLVLYYPQYQFLATFTTDVPNEGGKRIICPQSINPTLDIWEINTIVTYQDIEMCVLGPDPTSPLKELDKVTDMSIEEFYQIFSNPKNEDCIETPAKYWP